MDRLIKQFAALDGDLIVSEEHGFAYQHDMSVSVSYDDAYFDKYVRYEGAEIAQKLNTGRVAFVNEYVGNAAPVLDVGVGSGEFIKSRPHTFGYDINPKAEAWLKQNKRWADCFGAFEAFTFWDVLEHVPEPESYFKKMHDGAHLFTSIPIFTDLKRIRESKHYRPNEHYYYFTERGFVQWMVSYGFELLEADDFESRAGREDIMSFAFVRTG